MDESQTLDALTNLLNDLAEKPYDISLHAQHIRLTQSAESLETQVYAAREMCTNFVAAGEDVWIPLIEAKQRSVDLDSKEGLEELLACYSRAEADYLSIPILQKHLEFLINRHAHFSSPECNIMPDDLGNMFSTEWARGAIQDVVGKGLAHLTQGHLLWELQRDWEMGVLEATPEHDRDAFVDYVEMLHLRRLQQPHSNHEETSQSYSSFTTNYKPPQEYESLLVAASKIRSQAVKSYERREANENTLVQTKQSLEVYERYLIFERRARNPDMFVMSGVYERAIAEAAKRRFEGELGAEETLRAFWTGYCDALRINKAGRETERDAFKRATKSVPSSGEVWARYLRHLERASDQEENSETVSNAYNRALSMNLIQTETEQIVPLVLARAGYEKRLIEAGKGDESAFSTLVKVLEDGIVMVRQVSPTGDPRLRLEKYLAEIYLDLANLPESAISVWQATAKHCKTSYLAWTSYTDVLIKQDKHEVARSVFSGLAYKNLDWPEAIWEAWISLEHLYGSVDELEGCLDKVERAQLQLNARRAKEAENANFQAVQMASEYQAVSVPVADPPVVRTDAMDVDVVESSSHKRKAEDLPPADAQGSKKLRTEPKQSPWKRDRENCTVFVADMPAGVTEEELNGLFKDCGNVREVKITKLPEASVATVEFVERESVPAALTKDKKRLHGNEVAVHLAWKSTLYVTNFPEKSDDASMRELFGQFGTIFDVRWPSKKFKNTRRFCYVQFTSPTSAEKALELHGLELEPGYPMNVFLSNPERKKERSDADANEREIFVAGLSKFTSKSDLENLFKTYGAVREVRMAMEKDGHSKGFAFIEFEQEKDASAALAANNYELKKRRIAVTIADARARARNRNAVTDSGLSRQADARSRSVRIHNLPPASQEGLLQQVLEKHALVKRVEIFVDKNEAVAELENAAEAGKLLLRTDPVIFNGNILEFSEDGTAPPTKSVGLFVPRTAASRPRAGLGHARKPVVAAASGSQTVSGPAGGTRSAKVNKGKGQDDFRKLVG